MSGVGTKMIRFDREKFREAIQQRYGFLIRLFARFKSGTQGHENGKKRLALLDRISIAPRQSIVLIEAEGRRMLVATSPDGGSAFFPLDGHTRNSAILPQSRSGRSSRPARVRSARVPWLS